MVSCCRQAIPAGNQHLFGGRYAPKPRFSTPQGPYTASLDALLVGHEDWVHSVQWQPPQARSHSPQRAKHAQHGCNSNEMPAQQSATADGGAEEGQQAAQYDSSNLVKAQHAQHGAAAEQPCLLSTSMDRTMMLWRPDPATGWSFASFKFCSANIS